MTPTNVNLDEATARPWQFIKTGASYIIKNHQGNIAQTIRLDSFIGGSQPTNAALIVEAVNNYTNLKARCENLKEACQRAINRIDSPHFDTARKYAIRDDLKSALSQCGQDEKGKK